MKKSLWLTCLAVLVSATSFAAQAAEKPKAAAKPSVGQALTAQEKAAFAKQVDLFTQVATAGETDKDPLLLLSAVQMLDQLPFGGIERPEAKTDAKVDAKAKAEPKTFDREALLNLAKEYATGDAELLAVIAKAQEAPEPTAVRGRHVRHRGPGHYYERRYHERRHECDWVRVCGHHDCEWVCDEPRYRERIVRETHRRAH